MDSAFPLNHPHNSLTNISPRYSQLHNPHNHNQLQTPMSGAFYPSQRSSIDVDALAAGVQRYLPGRPSSYQHNNSYIALPPGVDPATVDFRTFYPYNPSEVKHRKRTTRPQLKVLEETFKRETKPNAALRKQLAAELEMTPRGVQVWFQNRRAKEKSLAKKASSSNASGRKAITLGAQNGDGSGDADGDVDRDDGDVVADDDNANCEQLAHPATQAPGTAGSLDERSHSHSSSNSPESTSPELTPPNQPVDFHLCVNVSPPGEDDAARNTPPDGKQDLNGFPRPTWQEPQRSMSRTPTSGMGMEHGHEYAGEMGYGANGMHMLPMQDQFMRRPSLPTHLGIGPSRVRTSHHGSPKPFNSPLGGVVSGRLAGFDPATRRMSLDRLASHPYAHLAAQANTAVYGPGVTRYRPTLPATTHSTPTLTPQARTTELPQVQPINDDATNMNGNHNPNNDLNSSNGMSELSLPPHLQQPPMSPPMSELRPELMHRQSLPAHLAMPAQFPSSAGIAPQPQSASPMPMRFPRPGHVFALSARNYQPPLAGPLPNPDFSFGSVGNGEGERAQTDESGTPDPQLQATLNNFQFPQPENGKDDGGAAGTRNGLDIEMDNDTRASLPPGGLGGRSVVYYRDAQGMHGATDPYASRFGSIASVTSIAETESSATSGGYFSSEASSNIDVQQDTVSSAGHSSIGYNDARRPSCTGSMMDMFSNLDMHNGSHSSLPHTLDTQQQDPHPSQMPISRSSELALALMPGDENKSSIYGGDNGSNGNVNMNEVSDTRSLIRTSTSSSDLSHGHPHGHMQTYPLAMSHSAGSSRSSLNVPSARPSRPLRLETDKLDFMHNYDAVSETGHYSPVSHPGSAGFDFGFAEPVSGGVANGNGSSSGLAGGGIMSQDVTEHANSLISRTPSQQFAVDDSRQGTTELQQQPPFYTVSGPFSKENNYMQQQQQQRQHASPYSSHGHSQEHVAHYGFFN